MKIQPKPIREDLMQRMRWLAVFAGVMLVFAFGPAIAQAQGNSHGKGHDKHGDADDQGEHYYKAHDREVMHDWYADHEGHLPPGLAKKDRLPPGLERQLVVRGTLPPGLQKRIHPCPEELERQLPPPPPHCEHVVIGGHIVLLDRRTNMVLDVF